MNDNARKQNVRAYFDGLAAKDMSRVPWAKDATLRTPLNPAGGESEQPDAICARRVSHRKRRDHRRLQLQIISSVNCGHAPRRQIGTACG